LSMLRSRSGGIGRNAGAPCSITGTRRRPSGCGRSTSTGGDANGPSVLRAQRGACWCHCRSVSEALSLGPSRPSEGPSGDGFSCDPAHGRRSRHFFTKWQFLSRASRPHAGSGSMSCSEP
jgi:hypothetical protein